MSFAMLAKKNAASAAKVQAPSQGPSNGLRIGETHDTFEREADKAADQVMAVTGPVKGWSFSRMSVDGSSLLRRKCDCGGSEECGSCKEKKTLQRKAKGQATAGGPVPSAVHDVLSSPGRPLDKGARDFFGPRFGHDFSGVRVYADQKAAQSAEAVSANAYTVSNKIVFNSGKYSPHSSTGRKLLAHELAHVVQQSKGGLSPNPQGEPSLEKDADHAADAASGGSDFTVAGASGPGIARDAKPAEEVMYEVKFPDGVKRLTAAEYEAHKQRLIRNLRVDLKLVGDLAENGRSSQIDMLKEYHGGVESLSDIWHKPKALIGIAADMKAGVTPPYIGMWSNPKPFIQAGMEALDRGDLAAAARSLQTADRSYRDALHEWNAYREATIGGAGGVISNLETVRNVSFAIALAAAAVVAAPVVAGAVGAAGVTGTGATALTALGTAGVTGTTGVVLGGGSTALATKVNDGKVDWKATKRDAAKWGKQGVVTGLTAGLGTALGAGKIAAPLAQQALRRCLTDAGINVAGEITTSTLDKVLPPEKGQGEGEEEEHKGALPAPARAALTGCITGAVGVPVGKIGNAAARKAVNTAVGAGVNYADARLAGQNNQDALVAAVQGTVTSAAMEHAQAASEHHAAQKKMQAGGRTPESPAKKVETPKAGVVEPKSQEQHAKAPKAPQLEGPPSEPKQASPKEKLAALNKGKASEEVAPAILKEEATAREPMANGHEAVATPHGVGACSPSPCPVIHLKYAKELAEFPDLKKRNDEIQSMRKTNPKKAASEAKKLIDVLEVKRKGASTANAKNKVNQLLEKMLDHQVQPQDIGYNAKEWEQFQKDYQHNPEIALSDLQSRLDRHGVRAEMVTGQSPEAKPAKSKKTKVEAEYGDIKPYNQQGKSKWTDGKRMSEHEHAGARVNWELQTRNPATGKSPYDKGAYRRSTTITIPEDMARVKTAMDLAVRDQLKAQKGGKLSPGLAERARPIESDVDRMIQARDKTIQERKKQGKPIDDLLKITDAKIAEAVHLQGSELHGTGKKSPSPFAGASDKELVDALGFLK